MPQRSLEDRSSWRSSWRCWAGIPSRGKSGKFPIRILKRCAPRAAVRRHRNHSQRCSKLMLKKQARRPLPSKRSSAAGTWPLSLSLQCFALGYSPASAGTMALKAMTLRRQQRSAAVKNKDRGSTSKAETRQAEKERYSDKLPAEGMPVRCLQYTTLGAPDKRLDCKNFDRLELGQNISMSTGTMKTARSSPPVCVPSGKTTANLC